MAITSLPHKTMGMETSAATPHSFPHSPDDLESTAEIDSQPTELQSPPSSSSSSSAAATKLQKVYRSYRTRRRLADSAVIAQELWWQVLNYTRLNHSTISFFNFSKPESAVSRWNRISWNASKVGQGLSKDSKALKLAFQHWIEAIDPRHRYGHNLHVYDLKWCESDARQPFFYWLDIGDGRNVDLQECPRSLLRQQCIKYMGPQERRHYEYVPIKGKIVNKQNGEVLDTSNGPKGAKWIFVMSASKNLYAGQKEKGLFHHSSFLAGGVTLAAGRFTAENGVLKSIWAYSGHYKPSEENLNNFLTFLRENGIDLNEVQIRSSSDENYYDESKQDQVEKEKKTVTLPKLFLLEAPIETDNGQSAVPAEPSEAEAGDKAKGKRTLSGGLQSLRADVPNTYTLERIKSKPKREVCSFHLSNQLSMKWCTGAGPRIGCVAEYPVELRTQALELVKLTPRLPPTPIICRLSGSCLPPASVVATGES